jgi:hypothetical protein
LTDEELTQLARPPRDEISSLLDQAELEAAIECLRLLEGDFKYQIDRYVHWIGSIFVFVADQTEKPSRANPTHATRNFFALYPDVAGVPEGFPPSLAAELSDLDPPESTEATLKRVDFWLTQWRDIIDLYRDWISALLTDLYRSGGPDQLEAAHRFVGQDTLKTLMININDRPEEQLKAFVRLLKGHFSNVTIVEEDEKFIILQDPCGTCARQITDGRYRKPLALAVIEDVHSVTWGRGPTTIYRTHIPVWHVLMAKERIGVPWPVNQCPSGLDGGPCRILLYKNSKDPSANQQVPGNLG